MNSPIIRYVFSFGILVFGFLVPILPRFYMIYVRLNNPERYKDVFRLLHNPLVYFMTVFPYIFLSGVAWFSLRQVDLSKESGVKQISGIIVSLIVMGYWGLAISMPPIWGLAAIFFMFGSILILPLTYWYGGIIGYWLVRSTFHNQMLVLNKTEIHVAPLNKTTLAETLNKSHENHKKL